MARMCGWQPWAVLKSFSLLISPDLEMVLHFLLVILHFIWFPTCRTLLTQKLTGLHAVWVNFLGELLALMVQQKKLIVSDKNVLPSFFTSLLSSSSQSLLVKQDIGKRLLYHLWVLCLHSEIWMVLPSLLQI